MEISELYTLFEKSSGVSIDSRTVQENQIFFAIKGDNFDGNEYAVQAIEKGASFSVVSDKSINHSQCIYFKDTLTTLQDLASFHRNYIDIKILALSGSNGKTTTKELIHHTLSAKFKVKSTKGNLNNHLGVPLTLLSFDKGLDIGIVEMGANHVHEIENLCKIAQPDMGFLTNIGKAHIGEFGGQENIIKGKSELYEYLKSTEGIIFVNDDDLLLNKQVGSYKHVVPYSEAFVSGEKLEISSLHPHIEGHIIKGPDVFQFNLNLGGIHNVENLKTALSIGFYFGIPPKLIAEHLCDFKAPDNRSQWISTENNEVFLDAYNANPSSVFSALNYFKSLEGERKFVIVGEMYELGEYAVEEHKSVYDYIMESGMEFLLVGKLYSNNIKDPRVIESKEVLIKHLKELKPKAYKILIKASRGMKLESIIELI